MNAPARITRDPRPVYSHRSACRDMRAIAERLHSCPLSRLLTALADAELSDRFNLRDGDIEDAKAALDKACAEWRAGADDIFQEVADELGDEIEVMR